MDRGSRALPKETFSDERGSYEIVVGDVNEALPRYKGKFRLAIADPPFAIAFSKSSHEYGAKDYKLYSDDMTKEQYFSWCREWIRNSFDALTPDGSMYIVSGWTNLDVILNAVNDSEFTLRNHLIWKFSWGVFARKRYVTSHYHILYLVKDPNNAAFQPQGRYEEDVWEFPGYNRGNDPTRIKGHPCQLPVEMIEKMLRISTVPGDWVGDVFSGSGTTLLGARKVGRNCVSFERDPTYVNVIKEKSRWGKPVAALDVPIAWKGKPAKALKARTA